MARIMNWFDAVYNCVIATWAEQSHQIKSNQISDSERKDTVPN
jgi:hypothetical protein